MSFPWLEGPLVSSSALHQHLVEHALGADEEVVTRAVRRCALVHRRAAVRTGPATGASGVWRLLAEPVVRALGWHPSDVSMEAYGVLRVQRVVLDGCAGRRALLVSLPWGALVGPVARWVCRLALEHRCRWAMVTNAQTWRWLDAGRPFGRQHVGLNLAASASDQRVWEALWIMGHASHHLDAIVALSLTLESSTTRAVRDAVAEVRQRLARQLGAEDDEVLTHVFRWLFLLFAEARGLTPMSNAIYRDGYALSTLARQARSGVRLFGLWDSLQASARLAHAGSRHPLLPVTALNGALFDPATTPTAARRHLPDAVVAPILAALTTDSRGRDRVPVAFGDLGVEHLGTIYEDVLAGRLPDRTRSSPASGRGQAQGLARKQTGTFYTPRSLADHLVVETLAPLVADRPAHDILALRILDPAAGSGAILASAARYLMAAVEAAWLREGCGGPLDVPAGERARVVRQIVEQCLFGVDRHGRAIQVARLSLWLASMAPERPLTFLDHHLRVGNSLVGTTPADIVARRPAGRKGGWTSDAQRALFELEDWDRQASALGHAFTSMAAEASDSADAVRAKARHYRLLRDRDVLRQWRARADLWCAAWMHQPAPAAGVWAELDRLSQGRSTSLPASALDALAATLRRLAAGAQCFHWPLEFPDIFHQRLPPGFDAVLANPPWEMLRADLGSESDRAATRTSLSVEQRFLSRSGLYTAGTTGHRNAYQLFVERMMQLCRHGGRIGIVAPWGLAADHGSAATRRKLFASVKVDRITAFENRRGIFPIHRSVRFLALSGTSDGPTKGLALQAGLTTADNATRADGAAPTVWVSDALLRDADREGLSIPYARSPHDLIALETMLRHGSRLGTAPWRLSFRRELNASDDRALLTGRRTRSGLPVIGGRHLRPFAVELPQNGPRISAADAVRRLPTGGWRTWRLGYRDVASPTNRLSLIAALVPPGVLTTHTVFVVGTAVTLRRQLYLCGILNSLVANWFVRLYLGTHVTSGLMARLPVPPPEQLPDSGRRVMRLTARLRRCTATHLEASHDYIALQREVARLYHVAPSTFAHIVETFPLLPVASRRQITAD